MPIKIDSCPFCGGLHGVAVLEVSFPNQDTYGRLIDVEFQSPVHFVKCPDCGLCYRDQTFSAEECSKLYSGPYRRHILKNMTADDYFSKIVELPAASSELDAKVEHLADLIGDKYVGRALDIGCGVGAFMYKLRARVLGLSIEGIEPTEEFAIVAAKRNETRVLARSFDGYDVGEYDLITCIHVLEHTEMPWKFLREIGENSRSGVYCYVETPSTEDIRALSPSHDRFMSPHNYLFSIEFMRSMLERAGFSVVDIGFAKTLRGKVDLRAFAKKSQ